MFPPEEIDAQRIDLCTTAIYAIGRAYAERSRSVVKDAFE